MSAERLSTGIRGLDTVFNGGFTTERSYVLRGDAGAGKTLVGLRFLEAGVERDETSLFVHCSQTMDELREKADSVGIDTDDISFLDVRAETNPTDEPRETFVADVSDADLVGRIAERISELDPDRVVVDPVTRLRHLFSDSERYREELVGLARHLKERGATVVFTCRTDRYREVLSFVDDGRLELRRDERARTLTVPKAPKSAREGVHGMRISDDGIAVFPALDPEVHERDFQPESLSSGIPQVDQLLDGGIERGTTTVISGATGVGKTTFATQFMKEAAGRGERSVIYMFEESTETFYERSEAINVPVKRMVDSDSLQLEEIEPVKRSSVEFSNMVRREVETHETDIVMIDGIEGYNLSLRDDRLNLVETMQALCRYLKSMGVTVILITEHDSMTGQVKATGEGISYLADNIILLQHLELEGELRKAIGVLKKRTSDYERFLREFSITKNGIKVGEPMDNLQGILTGMPRIDDEAE
ncbi:circadian clock protein KaiC [Haladaptatus litoreus]|uniref:non-specific serine/threonine protein kinase n=1 Tax=Haladaptatus litoreus TaxID=553468 RepID=A0A1N6W3L1_9EURY|nr:ATPase domain-containing protein [Haladaptatus litoreus]SIQ84476.1 circadian clock protein KaiC [Haladaptatus litoreus]